jgi:hypothetical protein
LRLDVLVPELKDSPDSRDPFWKQHADSVAQAFANVSSKTKVTLVAHSGAGPLLPVIRQSIPNPIQAYIFVDAGLPRDGYTRLDLMNSEDPEWAARFAEHLEKGGRFPDWSNEDLQEVIPDPILRRQMVTEIRPRGVSFFTEPIPVFAGWPDAHCGYIRLSEAYNQPAAQARKAGWPTYELTAGHFHMLVDADTVTNLILDSEKEIS